MFTATLSDPKMLADAVVSIGELIDEGIFKVDKDGIRLKAADRAMVAAIDFKILSTAFDTFELEESVNLGVNIVNLISVLKRAKAREMLTLRLKDSSRLDVVIHNSSRRKFTLPLLDLKEEELPQIEQLEFSCSAEVDSSVFKDGLEDASVVADSVLIIATPEKFVMVAEGDVSRTELELERGSPGLFSLDAKEETKARYPLDYLRKMVKASKVSDRVKLSWGNDYPIRLEFTVEDKLSLAFVLAPRVSEE